MSMTAQEIAGVVGTERKEWWPPLRYDAETAEWTDTPEGTDLIWFYRPALAELAFIGAAVRELAKRKFFVGNHPMELWHCGHHWHTRSSEHSESLLPLLVSALNESEGA